MSKCLPEIEDRDLLVFQVFEKGPSHLGEEPIAPAEAQALRRRFNVISGRFTVILIGKDGGTKMVCQGPVELQKIFDRIDSMPMRQREMRKKG
jgi:hypothetical protein